MFGSYVRSEGFINEIYLRHLLMSTDPPSVEGVRDIRRVLEIL